MNGILFQGLEGDDGTWPAFQFNASNCVVAVQMTKQVTLGDIAPSDEFGETSNTNMQK